MKISVPIESFPNQGTRFLIKGDVIGVGAPTRVVTADLRKLPADRKAEVFAVLIAHQARNVPPLAGPASAQQPRLGQVYRSPGLGRNSIQGQLVLASRAQQFPTVAHIATPPLGGSHCQVAPNLNHARLSAPCHR